MRLRTIATLVGLCALLGACAGKSKSHDDDESGGGEAGAHGGGTSTGGSSGKAGKGSGGSSAAVGGSSSAGEVGDAGAGTGGTGGFISSGGTGGSFEACGNGMHDDGEECDDGNLLGGDGCSAACRTEADYDCPEVGPCVPDQCGNGHVASWEACDDGNTESGDGCDGNCFSLEEGWECRVPGKTCGPLCGDGRLAGDEECDDANTFNGDGCSATCRVEPGASCDSTVLPSDCKKSACGNGITEAGESCDEGDANGLFYGDGSGCSKTCTPEPKCRDGATTRACDTQCGDGNIDDGEECDDGNQLDHDGCSADCREEPGFVCTPMERGDTVPCPSNPSLQCLVLPVTYRDFDPSTNPDFFYLGENSVTCVPDASGTPTTVANGGMCPATDQSGPCLGLASATLGADGTPGPGTNTLCRCIFTDHDDTGVIPATTQCARSDGSIRPYVDTMITGIHDIKKWYAGDGTHGMLELAQSGPQFQFASSVPGAPAGAAGSTLADDIHANCLGTARPLQSGFFPLDASSTGSGTGAQYCDLWPYWALGTSEASCATGASLDIKSQWDPLASYDNCPATGTGGAVPKSDGTGTPLQGVVHDYYFTSEARYLFRYSGTPAPLSFFGDDDVFVYVNGKLKVDLGAPHQRLLGSATIGENGDGLVAGSLYELAVFHANRNPRESNYQLTLPSFSTVVSSCMPTCGDGIATAAEECDLGTSQNNGEYGGCTPDCRNAGFCGDLMTNGPEECDDGAGNGVSYQKQNRGGCTTSCTLPHFCGDGIIDATDGEQCDDGDRNGSGRCKSDCLLIGPR